jgi:SAM-dependent methyltransferase
VTSEVSSFWRDHYQRLTSDDAGPALDYSNLATQAQTIALVIEALGPIVGSSVLDVGCGSGLLSLACRSLGASNVTGVDQNESSIRQLRSRHDDIEWLVADIASPEGPFDRTWSRVASVEVAQYLPFEAHVDWTWSRVSSGGRLVLLFPNGECPIVQSVVQRFEGMYDAPDSDRLRRLGEQLDAASPLYFRGLHFRDRDDQAVTPYFTSPWTPDCEEVLRAVPNRIEVVAVRG